MGTNRIIGPLANFGRTLWNDRRGQDMLEYALLGAFVASVAAALFPAITATSGAFSQSISLLSIALEKTAGQ